MLSSAEAKDRIPLACSLLTDTDMTADKIRAALLASAAEPLKGVALRIAQRDAALASVPASSSTPNARAQAMIDVYNRTIGRTGDQR